MVNNHAVRDQPAFVSEEVFVRVAEPTGRHRERKPTDLDEIERKFNGRPRETLGWLKPCEKLAELLQ
jgi:hypothetical protein